MREFESPISADTRLTILRAAEALYNAAGNVRAIHASDMALELDGDPVVAHEVQIKWAEGRMRVAKTEAMARPPFEWVWEVTSNMGDTDYFKHYLIRDHDVVLAQRRVLTPIDEAEAKTVLDDLAEATAQL